jgi:hypothetical protein
MPRSTIRKQLTACGTQGGGNSPGSGRAVAVARDGSKITLRWPCGYERTETLTNGVGRLKRPMSPDMVAFMSRYWEQGVTYECPRCRRAAMAAARKKNQ